MPGVAIATVTSQASPPAARPTRAIARAHYAAKRRRARSADSRRRARERKSPASLRILCSKRAALSGCLSLKDVVRQRTQRGESRFHRGVIGAQLDPVVLLNHECNFKRVDGIESDATLLRTKQRRVRPDIVRLNVLEIQGFDQTLRHQRL